MEKDNGTYGDDVLFILSEQFMCATCLPISFELEILVPLVLLIADAQRQLRFGIYVRVCRAGGDAFPRNMWEMFLGALWCTRIVLQSSLNFSKKYNIVIVSHLLTIYDPAWPTPSLLYFGTFFGSVYIFRLYIV